MDKASQGRRTIADDGAGAPAEASGDTRLLDMVEAEIIPRLMHAHRDSRSDAPSTAVIRPAEVEVFARALLDRSPERARALLADHCARGVGLEFIFLELFTAAARLLGEWWETDECNFSQVTLCLSRIQSMLHELSPSFHAGSATAQLNRSGERRT